MCGRFVIVIPAEELKAIFDLIENPKMEARYNVAPTQYAGVIRPGVDDTHNRFDQLKWGLIPSWSKDPSIASHMINARSETIAEKPSFRHAIKLKRCIVPVSGFYEWSHTGGAKTPFYIHMADQKPMSFAGVWENWKSPDGQEIESFSILTTASNRLIQPLHDRMPVILEPSDYDLWLSRDMHDPHALTHLYEPFPEDKIMLHEVPSLVNNPRFDSPACIARV